MYGVDVSHWQGKIDWSKFDLDFAILKVTQGTTFVDNFFSLNKSEARKRNIILGFYHFANGGDPVREANFFLKTIGEIKEGELLVLDFEIQIANIEVWCKKFLTEVYDKTGIRPILYINSATAKSVDWTVIAKYYALWIANYGINDGKKNKEPAIGAFPRYLIWQYTSNGIAKGISTRCDLNYCPYSKEVLKKYGKQSEPVPAKIIEPVKPEPVILPPEIKVEVLEATTAVQEEKIANQAEQINVITDKHAEAKALAEELQNILKAEIAKINWATFIKEKFKALFNFLR